MPDILRVNDSHAKWIALHRNAMPLVTFEQYCKKKMLLDTQTAIHYQNNY